MTASHSASVMLKSMSVPKDARDVHQDVDPPERLDRLVDHGVGLVPVRHRAVVRDRRAAVTEDLVDHLIGRRLLLALAAQGHAEVVDDDFGLRRPSPWRCPARSLAPSP